MRKKKRVLPRSDFDCDFDDSSDEESSANLVKKFDFASSYDGYLAAAAKTDEDKTDYSFMTYCVGVNLLFSAPVSSDYYGKKKSLLKNKKTLTDFEKKAVKEWVYSSLKCAVETVFNEHGKYFSLQDFMNSNDEYLLEMAGELSSDVRIILKYLYFDKVSKEWRKKLGAMADHLCRQYDYSANAGFEIGDLSGDREVINDTEKYVLDYIENNELSNNGKLISKKERERKIGSLIKNKDIRPFDLALLEKLKSVSAQKCESFVKKHIKQLVVIRIKKAIELAVSDGLVEEVVANQDDLHVVSYRFCENVDIEKVDSFNWLYVANEKILKKYLPISIEEMVSSFAEKILEELREELKKQKTKANIVFNRACLPPQYNFKSRTSAEFLANMRLAYRDQLRQIRNAKDSGRRYSRKVQRSWQLNEREQALEDQETTKNGARKDLVVNLANYELIYERLSDLITKINNSLGKNKKNGVADSDFARWIKEIIFHEDFEGFARSSGDEFVLPESLQGELEHFLVNLTSLLFNCEGSRNPAALVLVPMALDLIEDNRLSWQAALNKLREKHSVVSQHKKKAHIKYGGGEIPMTMGKYTNEETDKKESSDVVSCARALQEKYGLFSVKKWRYPGEFKSSSTKNSPKIAELSRRENDLVKRWFAEIKKKPLGAAEEDFAVVTEYVKSNYGV